MQKSEVDFPYLLREFPKLQKIPWISLIHSPTPVEKLIGLEKEIGFNGLYIKRDDLTHSDYGGNKPRKFEFLLGRALKRNKKHILTMGGIGSNHCVANSMLCNKLGLKSVVFLENQPLTKHVRKNILLELYYKAKIVHKETQFGLGAAILWYMLTHWRSYLIWAGGSNKIGVLGYVNAAFELKSQIEEGLLPEPDHIFTTTGSSGTTAGLLLGCELAGLKSKIFGITVTSKQWASKKLVLKLASKCLKYMRRYDIHLPDIPLSKLESRLEINQHYWGGQYGIVTDKGQLAVDLIKKTDNIQLDTTYTGKTLSALLDYIKFYKDSLQNKTILYINSYSSVDQSEKVKNMDFHNLDKKLHRYFDGSIPLSEKIVKIDSEFKKS